MGVIDATMTRPIPATGTSFLADLDRVVVAGLGRSGRGAAALLAGRGVRFSVVDARAANLPRDARDILPADTEIVAQDAAAAHVAAAGLVVVSPGIDLRRQPWAQAAACGVPFMSELELAWRFVTSPLLAITGSNGKSTVTAMVGRLLAAAGADARVCGNIGTPLSAAVAGQREDTIFVVEVSSFQLEAVHGFRPDVAMLLNITPDHQNRYDKHADYLAAKEKIFARQGRGDRAILDLDDPAAAAVAKRLSKRRSGPALLPVSLRRPPAGGADGAWLADDTLILRHAGKTRRLLQRDELTLAGSHNVTNALAAALMVAAAGKEPDPSALAMFPPLPHRLETVARHHGVRYVNDSKATNVESARAALRAFACGRVLVILGGRDKGGDFASLVPDLRRQARAVYAMGEAGPAIAEALRPGLPGEMPVSVVPDLAAAVTAATAAANAGDVILLAPACASFDAYSDFTARGEHFRRLAGSPSPGEDHHGA